MSEHEHRPARPDRAAFHAQHQLRAEAQAREWLARRESLQGAWLNWVAAQLYQLSPAEYAAMVRRELQRQAAGADVDQ